ncbi:NAD(P)-binding protein [Stipitochalara longipes BDJ]|nr:NAD(P)-binding protein [Stipitochalara longipes BDJ]
MVASINTILILGATSGIGEAFTRYFHSKGKKVIAAGRRIERLRALESELKGLETLQIDLENVQAIEPKLQRLVQTFPDLDSVFVVSGKMEIGFFSDPSSTSTNAIVSEITTNLLAPIVIARAIIPHLLSLKRPATFITVTSGLAFIPLPIYPVYNTTKAGLHTFNVVLRTQLAGSNVNVIELAPPYVDTGLDERFREKTIELQGGPEKAVPPMPLKEYMDSTTAAFEKGGQKEIALGFSQKGVDAWRAAFGPILREFGFEG